MDVAVSMIDVAALLHNIGKPILLFFYAGFLASVLGIDLKKDFLDYQKLFTFILLLAVGWHGGEEMAKLSLRQMMQVVYLIPYGFCTNLVVGMLAYVILRKVTDLCPYDAATVAGYYGSDSAGTFATCVGFLAAINVGFDPYMPVLLTVMELPGCFIALLLVQRLRGRQVISRKRQGHARRRVSVPHFSAPVPAFAGAGVGGNGHDLALEGNGSAYAATPFKEADPTEDHRHFLPGEEFPELPEPIEKVPKGNRDIIVMILREPGVFALVGGLLLGFVCGLEKATGEIDRFFVGEFTAILALFLLGTGYKAGSNIGDLRKAGWKFIACALLMPNLFAVIGLGALVVFSLITGISFQVGSYLLFMVLCGAASYIAMPAVQNSAIPEASHSLPLAASLGLTFTYNVSLGIPLYYTIATSALAFLHLA